MNAIAIIPARKGSKRIPRKNLVTFDGRPLIAWTIQAALDSGIFDTVLVSTDDEEIVRVARDFRAEAPFLRSAEYSDAAQVPKATLVALNQAEKYYDRSWDFVFQLLPTCPLRGPSQICDFANDFYSRSIDAMMTCFHMGWMNPWWSFKLDAEGAATELFPNNARDVRSQDNPTLYCVSGAIWAAKTETFKKSGTFYLDSRRYHVINWKHAIDVDDYEDLEMALVARGLCANDTAFKI